MSLSTAVKTEWLDDETRAEAKARLDNWRPLPIESAEIQDWIAQVLGYFRCCYVPDSGSRNVQDIIITNARNPMEHIDRHRGVDFIRKYYPSFVPTQADFDRAYWGRKQGVKNV